MVAVTFDAARVSAGKAAQAAQAKAPRKPWYARLMDALIEARTEQARREVARHRHYLNYMTDARGNPLVKTGREDMPFGGW